MILVTCARPGWKRIRESLNGLQMAGAVTLLGEGRDPDAAVRAAVEACPTLLIVSFHPRPASRFSDGTHLPLVRELRACSPASKLLVLGRHFSPREALVLHDLQVNGVVSWQELAERDISSAVQALLDGYRIHNAGFQQALAEAMLVRALSEIKPLTDREGEVVALIRERQIDKEVARRLDISTKTVDSHIEHIMLKLGARDRVQLGMLLKEYGLA